MVIGVLQVELKIGEARSLKDKRRILASLKDRLHRKHGVAVAEVGSMDAHQVAVLGIVAVSNSAAHAQGTLSRIVEALRHSRSFLLSDQQIEILTGVGV